MPIINCLYIKKNVRQFNYNRNKRYMYFYYLISYERLYFEHISIEYFYCSLYIFLNQPQCLKSQLYLQNDTLSEMTN